MKGGVVDLFIAKDRIAIFWFMMACGTAVATTAYTTATLHEVRKRPQYIYLDGAGTWYLAPGSSFQEAEFVHRAQAQLATETIFNRGPDGLISKAPVPRLFGKSAQEYIREELKKEARSFANQDLNQTVQIKEIKILGAKDGAAVTGVIADVVRSGEFKGAPIREEYDLKVQYLWRQNPRMSENGMFPSVCVELSIKMQKKDEI